MHKNQSNNTIGKTDVCQPGDEGSITVSISRKVNPGAEEFYEQWITGVIEAASHFAGHQGTSIMRPSRATNEEYVIIYRFDCYENCQIWERSQIRQSWLEKLSGIIDGEAKMQRGTGLEFWFDLPSLPVKKPKPSKMSLVLIVVVYVLVVALNMIFAPFLEQLSFLPKTLFIVVSQVLLMTYLVMPRVTKALQNWLYH